MYTGISNLQKHLFEKYFFIGCQTDEQQVKTHLNNVINIKPKNGKHPQA